MQKINATNKTVQCMAQLRGYGLKTNGRSASFQAMDSLRQRYDKKYKDAVDQYNRLAKEGASNASEFYNTTLQEAELSRNDVRKLVAYFENLGASCFELYDAVVVNRGV